MRWDTADGVGDAAIDQLKTVIGRAAVCALGEAVVNQSWIEQIARIIAGKRPSGSVGPFEPWGEADDQELGGYVAERGDGGVVPIGPGFGIGFAKFDKAGAKTAIASRFFRGNGHVRRLRLAAGGLQIGFRVVGSGFFFLNFVIVSGEIMSVVLMGLAAAFTADFILEIFQLKEVVGLTS